MLNPLGRRDSAAGDTHNYCNRKTKFKTAHRIGMITQITKYPAWCKIEDKNVAINMVHTDKNRNKCSTCVPCSFAIINV